MYETGNKPNDPAVKMLSDELRSMNIRLPGVLAEQGLAHRFAEAYAGSGRFRRHMSMNIMRLDKVNDIQKAPGHCRPLTEDDLFFIPYWELACNADCSLDEGNLQDKIDQVRARIGWDAQYIWEDRHPVSQAYRSKKTQNGCGISGVYTRPHYRGRGYASSNVAELSKIISHNMNAESMP